MEDSNLPNKGQQAGGTSSVVAAVYADENGSLRMKQFSFEARALAAIKHNVLLQRSKLDSLKTVPYSVDYVNRTNEAVVINGYVDSKSVFSLFESFITGGKNIKLKNMSVMEDCFAILFYFPEFNDEILIQRFSPTLIAGPDKYFGLFSKDTFRVVQDSYLSFASSLAGIYYRGSKGLKYKNLETICSTIPGFEDQYAGSANEQQYQAVFGGNARFDINTLDALKKFSRLSKLVWILDKTKQDLSEGITFLESIAPELNLQCFSAENKIQFQNTSKKNEVILRCLMGQIYRFKNQIRMTYTSRVLQPFK